MSRDEWVEGMCRSMIHVYTRKTGPHANHSLSFHSCGLPDGHFLPHYCPTCGSSWLNQPELPGMPRKPQDGPQRPPAA